MKNFFALLAGLCLLSCVPLFGFNDFFIWRISEVKTPPRIDGHIESAEWRNAARLPAFNNSIGLFSDKRQNLMLCFDNEHLYVALRTVIDWEPEIKTVQFDDLTIWTVDSFDIALIPVPAQKNNIVRFVVERGGGYADMRANGQVKKSPNDWNPEWKRAGRLIAQSYMSAYIWELEIAIPWKSLGIACPSDGDMIPAQFMRCLGNIRRNVNGDSDRVVTWTPVPKGRDWINPQDFGQLIFCKGKTVFRAAEDSVFGVKGSCTVPVESSFDGRLWKIGHFGKPLKNVEKLKSNGMNLNWPTQLKIQRSVPAIMYWRLRDEDGIICAGRYTTTLQPSFKVQVSINYYRDLLMVLGNLQDIPVKDGFHVKVELKDKSGRLLDQGSKSLAYEAKYFELECPIRNLPMGESVAAEVRLMNSAGQVLYIFTEDIQRLPRPEWMKADTLGKVSVPPPGWNTPTVQSQSKHIEIKTGINAYCFGASSILPESIKLRKQPFSDGTFTLEARTSQGPQILHTSAPPEIVSQDACGITLQYQGLAGNIKHQTRIRVEFDGMAWYQIVISPRKEKLTIQSLFVNMPLLADQVRYMRANNAMNVRELIYNSALVGSARTSRPLPKPDMQYAIDFSANGWIFNQIFHNFYWLGGEDKGIFFALPSFRNMSVNEKYTEVVDDGHDFTVKFYLIDHPVLLNRPVEYQFGFFLTPTKKIKNRARLRRVGAGYVGSVDGEKATLGNRPLLKSFTGNARGRFFYDPGLRPFGKNDVATLMLPCWKLRTVQMGNPLPLPEELNYMDRWIVNTCKKAGTPMLWYDAFFTPYRLPGTMPFLNELESWPITRLPVEQHGTYVCPSRAWQNFYLSGVRNRMKQKITSFYMDLTFLKPCSNRFHGCGYRDDNGKIHGEIPLLEAREMFLRYQTMVKKNDPEGLLVLHGYTCTPLALWVDVLTSGEEWLTAPDYSSLTPEYFQSILMGTDQLGVVANFFPSKILMHYLQAQKSSSTLAEMCGLSFIHGESLWNGTEAMMPGMRMVWDALDQFGVDQAVWKPYWRNPLSDCQNDILISSWEYNSDLLLVVFNSGYTRRKIKLDTMSNYRIYDCLNAYRKIDENIDLSARGFALLLARHL